MKLGKVESGSELEKVKKLGDTIYLRKNIEQVEREDEEEATTMWQADEVSFDDDSLEVEEIENNFEKYWEWGVEKAEKEEKREQKKEIINELVDDLKLADLKEVVDTLVAEILEEAE